MTEEMDRFRGFWMTSSIKWAENDRTGRPITVFMFFDNGVVLRSVKKPKPGGEEDEHVVDQELLSHFVEGDLIEMTPVSNTSSLEEADWSTYQWRPTMNVMRPLELRAKGQSDWEPFVPCTLTWIEDAGFPREPFEAWIEAGRKRGWGFTEEPRFPASVERFFSE